MRSITPGALLGLAVVGCTSSPSYGTPQDCAAAGGQCVLGSAANVCAKQGPDNTCNCNPACNPGGSFCCLAFIDAGVEASARDAIAGE
jgi:hypothetical protein